MSKTIFPKCPTRIPGRFLALVSFIYHDWYLATSLSLWASLEGVSFPRPHSINVVSLAMIPSKGTPWFVRFPFLSPFKTGETGRGLWERSHAEAFTVAWYCGSFSLSQKSWVRMLSGKRQRGKEEEDRKRFRGTTTMSLITFSFRSVCSTRCPHISCRLNSWREPGVVEVSYGALLRFRTEFLKEIGHLRTHWLRNRGWKAFLQFFRIFLA